MGDAVVVFSPSTITAGATVIQAGASMPSIPSISDINASSDWNQVIGLVNRRTSQVWPALSYFSYLSPGELPTAALVNSLRTRINTLRTGVGGNNFNFGTAVSSGNRILATQITALRSALGFAGTKNIGGSGGMKGWFRNDSPYGTQTGVGFQTAPLAGKYSGSSGGDITRFRALTNFGLSSATSPNFSAASILIQIYSWSNSLESWAFEIWSSATDDSAYSSTAVAYNLDFFEASVSYGLTGLQSVSVDASRVAAKSGAHWSIVMGSNRELSNSGAGGSGNSTDRAAAQVVDPVTGGVQCLLVLDWGF